MAKILNIFPWRRRRKEQDLDRELRYHVERRVDDLKRSGLADDEARREAALEFGSIGQLKEEVRDAWVSRWLDNLSRDVRFAGRMLLRSPGFTATAVVSLALGIGANAAIFSLIDQVFLRTLPVVEAPDRIVHLDWAGSSLSAGYGSGNRMSYALCRDLHEQKQFFDGVFCRYRGAVNFSTGGEHEQVGVEIVSGSYFRVLGIDPHLGRLIEESDDVRPEGHPVVVLSYNFWKNNLGSAPDAVGRKVLVNNYPMTVIGIAPPGFSGVDMLSVPEVWLPAMMLRVADPEMGPVLLNRRTAWMNVFGRLKPGMALQQAQAGLQPWFKAMLEGDTRLEGFPAVTEEQYQRYINSRIDLLPAPRGVSDVRGSLQWPLSILTAGTVLLLLLACLNIAGLLLARGVARSQELTTRMAIGATRGRITNQLLVETMLLTLGGGLVGLLAAPTISQVLRTLLAENSDLTSQIDYRIFVFALLLSMITGALCGLAPILQTGRIPLIASLKERSRVASKGSVRLRKVLVAAQMAFTLLLLIGAGLFAQTLARLHAKVEFPSRDLVMFSVDPPSMGYSEPAAEQAMRDILGRVQALPGVESAAIGNKRLLISGPSAPMTLQADERIVTDRGVPYMRVSPGFFSTLGMPIIAGRDFDERDVRPPGKRPTRWRSVIINERFARRYFGDRNPVGYSLGVGNRADVRTDIEIIGVVRDFNHRSLREDQEHAFFPFWDQQSTDGAFYLRMRGNPESAFASIRAAVQQVDPLLHAASVMTYEDQIDWSLTSERALATLLSSFGMIALILSVVGLYGVMSLVVTHRTHEIGIRMAIGGTRPAAVWLVVRDALIMVGAGTAVALPAAWALRSLIQAQLFGISAIDGLTIAAAACLLGIVALGAAMLPAWRAASISPTEALRLE